jgi:hypothetical protein
VTRNYVIQDVATGRVLDYEFPLATDGAVRALSAVGSLTGTVAPDTGTLRGDDKKLQVREWGTFIYEEEDGEIRWGGIVDYCGFSGKTWTITAHGFATYPHGMPYQGIFYGIKTDPADVVRMLWAHLQGYRDGNLGVVVIGRTPMRLGTESDQKALAALTAYNTAKDSYNVEKDELDRDRKVTTATRNEFTRRNTIKINHNKELTRLRAVLSQLRKDKAPAAQIAAALRAVNEQIVVRDAAEDYVNAQRPVVAAAEAHEDAQAAVYAKARDDYNAKNKIRKDTAAVARDDGGSYKLEWWEAPDIGEEIDNLAAEVPFDWTERHYWVPNESMIDAVDYPLGLVRWLIEVGKWTARDGDRGEYLHRPDGAPDDQIAHVIEIAYPRLGRLREDLTFVQGENITEVITPELDGEEFANEILGVGAGEGAGSLRASTAVVDNRLRRVKVHTAKGVKSQQRLDGQIRDQLLRRRLEPEISSIKVSEHLNAPIGSWDVGDDITIQAVIPWLGKVDIRHRVTSWSPVGTNGAVINLARSDQFTYGG